MFQGKSNPPTLQGSFLNSETKQFSALQEVPETNQPESLIPFFPQAYTSSGDGWETLLDKQNCPEEAEPTKQLRTPLSNM